MFNTKETGDRSAVATVTNNNDPEKRGRIKVTCIALGGDGSSELPMWVETALPWGWFAIPDVDQQVTVYWSLGSSRDLYPGQSSVSSLNVRWGGGTNFTAANATNPTPIGEEFTERNYGKRRGFKTPNGHVMLFDDTPGDQQIRVTWAGGSKSNPKTAYWAIDKDGSFIIQDAGGSLLLLNAEGEASLIHPSGNRLTLTEDGISLVDKHNNAIVMNADGISIMSQGPIVLHGSDTVVRNALHFIDATQITTNMSGIAAITNSLTPAGLALQATVAGAVPADGVALLAGLNTIAQT
jgi:hypothetical protein